MTHTLTIKMVTIALLTGLCGMLAMPTQAAAFCGFYVSNNDAPLYNNATQVVFMREGTQTVLSMRNSYSGPAEDFAMVVPVPVVLQEADVKTLDDAIFERLNNFTSPRLVEYFEKNPCANSMRIDRMSKTMEMSSAPYEEEDDGGAAPLVVVEAQFEVGEYEIVVLSAKESTALETWLTSNAYNIPKGASEVLQSYITQGQYFFVAKVNSAKVKFDPAGNAVLSPLRFSYNAEDFGLPVRLGLLNANGAQDLLVHIISREGRYRVANGENITIPTNLIVDERVKDRFADFYEALFSKVHEESPAAIVTEYAWGGSGVKGQTWTAPVKCDPCAEPISQPWATELMSLGADLFPAPKSDANTGSLKAQATAMAIESNVIMKALDPPPVVEDPSLPTQPVQPGPKVTYDVNAVQAVIMEQTASIGSCYETLSQQQGKQPEIIDIKIDIAPDGSVARIASPESSPEWNNRVERIAACAGLKSLVFAAPDASASSVEAIVRLQFDVSYIDTTWLDINSWTVTRLHARYTATQLENDLFFTVAPPIIGGRGTPSGPEPRLPTQASSSDVNNFQSRYIILHPYTKWHMCMNPQPGDWTGSNNAMNASASMKARAASSGASKEKEEEALNVMHVVKNKRGWLKKSAGK